MIPAGGRLRCKHNPLHNHTDKLPGFAYSSHASSGSGSTVPPAHTLGQEGFITAVQEIIIGCQYQAVHTPSLLQSDRCV